jgi:hypothetical protein
LSVPSKYGYPLFLPVCPCKVISLACMDCRTLIMPSFTSLCESVYAFSLDDDLGRLDLRGATLQESGGSLSSKLSSLRLSHLSRLCRSSDPLGRGELVLPSAFLPRLLLG